MCHPCPGGDRTILCTEHTLVNYSAERIVAQPLYCRSWQCDICQPRRQAQLVAAAKRGRPDTFITLTSNPARFASPVERAKALADAWRIVVKRAKRKYGYETLPYLCVFEATKAGEPHLHILARCKWIDQAWLSDQMRALTGAPIVDIRRVISTDKAAHYVAKYVGKEPHHFATCKRYWSTRDFTLENRNPDDEDQLAAGRWDIVDYCLDLWIEAMQHQGHTVEAKWDQAIVTLRGPP